MRSAAIIACVMSMAIIGPVLAQTPATPPSAGGTPDKIPFDIPYGPPISLSEAKQVLAAAESEATKRNWKMNIAVVDPGGHLIYFVRMDGAMLASVTISQGKARTAALFRRETRLVYNAFEAGHPYMETFDPKPVASPGGFPLVADGKLIGAIGCSGGTGDQDATVCKAGVDLLAADQRTPK